MLILVLSFILTKYLEGFTCRSVRCVKYAFHCCAQALIYVFYFNEQLVNYAALASRVYGGLQVKGPLVLLIRNKKFYIDKLHLQMSPLSKFMKMRLVFPEVLREEKQAKNIETKVWVFNAVVWKPFKIITEHV